MKILASELDAEQTYRLLSGAVVPRPVAWVTTLSANGKINAAPFSAFTFVSTEPGMVGISLTRRDGRIKDTEENILARHEFVVNIVDRSLLDCMHHSSAPVASDISEVERLGLEVEASALITTPRLKKSPVSFECRFSQAIPFGRWHRFIVGEVVAFQVRDGLLVNGKIETEALAPVARIGGPLYAELGTITKLPEASLS